MHPPLKPERPVLRWGPGDPVPDNLDAISGRLRSRWNQPGVPTKVYVATKKAANLFGSTGGGLPELNHRDHDMLLADAFSVYLRKSPSLASQWLGEHLLPKAGFRIKDPDAFLVAENGVPYQIIESGGSYSIGQIAGLIQYARARSLVLELW